MGFDIGEIAGRLVLNKAKWSKGVSEVKRDTEKMSNYAEQLSKKWDKLGDTFTKVGKKLSLFVTAPLLAAGGAAIKMAMDAMESENLFEVSMGNMAGAARSWSKELSKSLGLNQYETRKTVGTFNVMLKSMGMNKRAAFDMSKGLVQLGYDMASFYNMHPEEVFLKLQSGITGEIEPLKRLGIVVNETTIKQWALNKGLIKQKQELTESQKILARYNVIMEQTRDAQGDLDRTLDSPANKLRILKSRIKEVTIELGIKLLPTYEKFLRITERIVSKLSSLSDAQRDFYLDLTKTALVVAPAAYAFGKLVKVIGLLKTSTTAALGPWGLLLAGVAMIGVGIRALIKNYEELKDKQLEAIVKSATPMAKAFAMRRLLINNEIVTVKEWSEMWHRHGRNYARLLAAIEKHPAYEHIRKALERIKEEQDKTGKSMDDLGETYLTVSSLIGVKSDEMKNKAVSSWWIMQNAAVEAANKIKSNVAFVYEETLPKLTKGFENFYQKIMYYAEYAARHWKDHIFDFEKSWKEAWYKVFYWASYFTSQLGGISNQMYDNEMIRIDNEYERRKKAIEATIKDEKKRTEALEALEDSIEKKRKAAWRREAARAKSVAIFESIINTASAFVEALPDVILAATVAALGAVKTAYIAAQPLPSLKEGGIFERETILPLKVGDARTPEVFAPIEKFPELFEKAFGRMSQRPLKITIPLTINTGGDLERKVIEIIWRKSIQGQMKIHHKVIE